RLLQISSKLKRLILLDNPGCWQWRKLPRPVAYLSDCLTRVICESIIKLMIASDAPSFGAYRATSAGHPVQSQPLPDSKLLPLLLNPARPIGTTESYSSHRLSFSNVRITGRAGSVSGGLLALHERAHPECRHYDVAGHTPRLVSH